MMAEIPQFDPSQAFEEVGAGAPPAFDPSKPFEEVGASPSRESTAPQWLKSFAEKVPSDSMLTPLKALPETYDVGKEMLHALNPVVPNEEANAQREELKRNAVKLGYSEQFANDYADRMSKKMGRGKALWAGITGAGAALAPALGAAAIPAMGAFRKFAADPLERAGGPPREVSETAAMIGAAGAGLRPGMNTVRRSLGLPLEGEVLPPGGTPPGGPRPSPSGGGPTIEGEWTSPATPREGTNARLLPHDYRGNGLAGDPHFDAAWESLGQSRAAGAAGRPGGPLADVHPEAIQHMRDIVREEGLSPWELARRQEEDRSTHHFGGEWSDAMRAEMMGLNSLGGDAANIIGQSVRARRREAPERMREHFGEFFGERLDPREEVAKRKQAEEQARPFWREFDQAPIPPTPELAALNDALHASGAWTGAERALRMERVPRENQFVELPNTGEYVLANPDLPSETVRVPTARFYQAVKVRIDGMIDKAMAAPEGRDDVRILVGLKKALTEVIDNHPDPTVAGLWKRSREMSAGQKEWESSIALGRRALSEHVDPGDFSMLWDTLSDQEKLGVRKGAGESLGNRLGRVGNADVNTMRQVLGDNNQQKLRIMQESEGAADRLISNIEHEHNMSQGPITGPNTANKLAAQQRYRPKETWAQTAGAADLPHGVGHAATMGAKAFVSRMQRKSIEEAQKKQNQVNADVARLMTLQGPEWNAVVRYLHGVADEPSPGAGPSPRPAPARPMGAAEPPPPSKVPEGPPGYPQPEMTAVEATGVLHKFGYDQRTINSMGGQTRTQTAQRLLDEQREAARNPFPGEVTPQSGSSAGNQAVRQAEPVPTEKPMSLLEWIRKQGGISPDDPMIGDVRGMFGGKNPGGIIRKGGKKLDKLREGAVGEKYFLDKGDIEGREASTDVNTLLDAMAAEAGGEKQFPVGHEEGQARNKDFEEHAQNQRRELEFSPEARKFDRELSQHGHTRDMVPADARSRAIEMLRSGIETDPVEAFEKAMDEKGRRDIEAEGAAERGQGLEPLRLKVLERHRLSGRPKKVEPLRTGENVNQAILEAGYKRAVAPPFHSAVAKAIDAIPANKMQPQQWFATLSNKPGVKPEEMKWLGLEDWLNQQKGPVTKQQVGDYVRANQIEVKEVEKGNAGTPKIDQGLLEFYAQRLFDRGYDTLSPAEQQRVVHEGVRPESGPGGTKFGQYQLPGGENYRELLLTLPSKDKLPPGFKVFKSENGSYGIEFPNGSKIDGWRSEEDAIRSQLKQEGNPQFQSSHWDEPNVLAHIRFNDRTIDGKHTLMIEEVQSDWHQQGRTKGYGQQGPIDTTGWTATSEKKPRSWGPVGDYETFVVRDASGNVVGQKDGAASAADAIRQLARDLGADQREGRVPDAPFKTTWPELSLKRMIRYAAENGYDQIAWTPGKVQAERYDLSKHISKIEYEPAEGGKYEIKAHDLNGKQVLHEDEIPLSRVEEIVGKEMAQKIEKREGEHTGGAYREWRTLSGLDLKVGGEGMLGFYDKMLPTAMNKLVKKYGARVAEGKLKADNAPEDVVKQWEARDPEHPFVKKNRMPVHTVVITPGLRRAALVSGFPQFRHGGAVNRANGGRVDPNNIHSSPSEAQKEAGNYAKDHIRVHGLDITIENAKGSERSGVDKGGKKWSVTMPAHYGYIKGTVGKDKDHVDVYLGPHLKCERVYVMDQLDADTRKFDEHKCFIGFCSIGQVRTCYAKAFSDGKASRRGGLLRSMDISRFKDWLSNGDTTKPIAKAVA